MASAKKKMKRMAGVAGVTLALLGTGTVPMPAGLPSILGPSVACAQSAPKAGRAHSALTSAIEAHLRGDYDQAADLLGQAQAGMADLSASEQKDLTTYLKRNSDAITGRRDGADKIRLAEVALQEGRNADALDLLKKAQLQRDYLANEDRVKFNQLGERLRSGATAQSADSAKVARSKMQQARSMLARANFDAAEQLVREVDALNVKFAPGEDNPRHLREEIARDRTDAKFLLGAARAAFDRNELDRADALAMAADKAAGSFTFTLASDSPSKLRKEIVAARAKSTKTTVTSKSTPKPSGTEEQSVTKVEEIKKDSATTRPTTAPVTGDKDSGKQSMASQVQDPRVLLRLAREKLDAGNYDEATQLAKQAKTLGHGHWKLLEDTPDQVLRDIDKARVQKDKDEAAKMLAEGRRKLEEHDFAAAKKAAYQAQKLHGTYAFYESGDRPQKLLDDVEVAEAKWKQTKQAPVAVVKNDLKPKTEKTEVIKQVDNRTPATTGTQPAPEVSPYGGAPRKLETTKVDTTIDMTLPPLKGADSKQQPAPIVIDAKQRAQQLMGEARQMQNAGKLLEARAKLLEAQKLNASFTVEEENPATVLLQLNSLAYRKMVTLMDHAEECAKSGLSDPAKCRQAEQGLTDARVLAVGFGLDTTAVDHKTAWLKQVTGKTAMQPTEMTLPATGTVAQGTRLLDHARDELRRGDTASARKITEEIYKNDLNARAEAEKLLRSIDQEEYNQRRLAQCKNFDAALKAYYGKDYAFAGKILATIDTHLLDQDRQTKLKDIMMSPQMQTKVVQTAHSQDSQTQAGMARATDQPGEDLLKQAQAIREIEFQKLRSEVNTTQSKAIERFQVGDRDQALEMLSDLSTRLSQNTELSAEKITLLKRPVDDRIQKFRTLKAQMELAEERDNSVKAAKDHVAKAAMARENKDKKVAELMAQYEVLFRDNKSVEAMRVAQLAVDLDPDNVAATAALRMAKLQNRMAINKEIKEHNEDWWLESQDSLYRHPDVNDAHMVHIDANVSKENRNRKYADGILTGKKSAIEKEIEYRLLQPVNLKFTDTPLEKVLEDLRTWQNINIFLDKQALQEAGINPAQPMSATLEGISLKSALNLILGQSHLTHVIQNEVLVVTTETHARGKLVQKIYPVADLVTPVRDAINPNTGWNGTNAVPTTATLTGSVGATPMVGPQGLTGGTMVSTPTTPTNGTSVTKQNASGTIESTLIELITHTVGQGTWAESGGHGTIDYFPLGMALVINQTPDIQEQVADLLTALRRLQDLEVAVEIRFITIAEGFFERIGIDFNMNIKTDSNTTKFEPMLTSGQFKPAGFVNDFSPKGFLAGLTPAGSFTSDLDIPIRTSSFAAAAPPPFGGFSGGVPNGGLDVGLAFLSDIQVFLFMEAVQGDQRTNVTQAPKLMMFNGQTATLTVTETQNFVTGVNVQVINGNVTFQPNITPTSTGGIFLSITPVVSADRRFVRLSLSPTITNLASAIVPLFPVVVPIIPQFDGGIVGVPVSFTQFIQTPVTSAVNVTTTVTVPDGGTVLLGGLKRLSEGRNESGPPVLSKIPYLNRLFRNVGYAREAESLMMMVTPRIIITEEEELKATGVAGGPPS